MATYSSIPLSNDSLLAEKGIRANTVALGPIWTPLPCRPTRVANFGKQVPMKAARTTCRASHDVRHVG
jgi:NAD(P)-dependent dehydrogenase (short-subunit alcohol dehydrogenase family)